MRKSLFIFIILFICLNSFSQEKSIYIDGYPVNSFTIPKSNSGDSDINGNPYFNKDWMYGELVLKDSSIFKGLFKYNIHQQQIEMVYKTDTFIISNPLYIKYVKFSNITLIYSLIVKKGKKTDKLSGSFFEAHNNIKSKYVLLSKFKSDILVNESGSLYAGGLGDGSKRYSTNKTFYVKLNNGPAQKVNLSKNGIAKLFPDIKYIKKYIKEKNLSMNNANDVASLFDHFNNLSLSEL